MLSVNLLARGTAEKWTRMEWRVASLNTGRGGDDSDGPPAKKRRRASRRASFHGPRIKKSEILAVASCRNSAGIDTAFVVPSIGAAISVHWWCCWKFILQFGDVFNTLFRWETYFLVSCVIILRLRTLKSLGMTPLLKL